MRRPRKRTGEKMGDKPHWHIYYMANKDEKTMHHGKNKYLGSVFDNWSQWPDSKTGEFHEVITQRIVLKEDLFKDDIVEIVPAKGYLPEVTRISSTKPDFNWVLKGVKDPDEKNKAHSFLNKGQDGRPRFRVYVEDDLIAGSSLFQNPRKGSEDIFLRGTK